MKLTIISLITLFLLGCAAAGVPYTSDPMTKLNYAYQLMGTHEEVRGSDLDFRHLKSSMSTIGC